MTLSMNWSERVAKKAQRDKFFEGLGLCQSYLTLPGAQCVDVEQALEKGVLTHESRILAVEREGEDFALAHEWFRQNWPGAVPGLVRIDLHSLTALDKYDLVFLDYLGNLTFNGARWIREQLAPQLLPGARLGMTISGCPRGSVFVPKLQQCLQQHYPDLCSEIGRQLVDGGYPQKVLNYATPYILFLTCYLFPNHDYQWSLDYGGETKSTHQMLLFRLMNMHPVTCRLNPVELKCQKTLTKMVTRGYEKELQEQEFQPEEAYDMTTITGKEVIQTMIEADAIGTAGKKAAATRLLNRYADQRERDGKNRVMVIAGVKARIRRILNGNV